MNFDISKSINENSILAVGVHKIICDEKGIPVDYVFVDVNPAYERITGLEAKDIIGKKATEVFPKIEMLETTGITKYGEIALNGGSEEHNRFSDAVFEYYNFKVYSPEKDYFITMFSDIKKSVLKEDVYNPDSLFFGDVINFSEIQSLVDSFYEITNIAMAIGNRDGELLIKEGFQEICQNFHRKNPLSCRRCHESDTQMFRSVLEGEAVEYKCLNHMWDISTPIIVAGEIIGAVYLGQFFYDDEEIDYEAFRKQAEEFGFGEKEYMEALDKVPRVSREYIRKITRFYYEFAKIITLLSYKNIDILSANEKQQELIASLEKMEEKLSLVINNLPDVVMIYDKEQKVRYINEAIFSLLGRHKEDVIGKAPEEIWVREEEKQHLPELKNAFETKTIQSLDIECECPVGERKNLLFTYVPLANDSGTEVLSIIHDYTQFKLAEEEKMYQESLISEMGRAAKIGGWEFNPVTGEGTWTDEVARIHDSDPKGKTSVDFGLSFYTEESRAIIENAIKEAVEKAKPYDVELELITKKGARKWVRSIGKPKTENGKVVRVYGAFQDISEKKRDEERLKESELRHRTLLEKAPIGIAVHAQGRIVFANPAALAMFGTESIDQLIGKPVLEIVHPSGHEKTLDRIRRVQAGEKGLYPVEDLYVRSDGSTIPVEVMATPIRYEGKPAVQVIVTDITERKKAEENLIYLSYHDQLTDIFNRRYFEEELLKLDKPENLPLTVVMADVNGLKLINDSFGHNYGDELLVKASNAIRQVCKNRYMVARLGGDEFVILLPKTDSAAAEEVVKDIKETMKKESVRAVALSVSFGYYTKEKEDENLRDILANAENHMYKQKIYESSSMHSKSVEIVMNTLYEKSERELEHSNRVSMYCEEIAAALNLDKDSVNQIKTAGLVHDIGKIGVDEKVLNKNGSLNKEEWEEIKKHPERGWRILITSNEFSELADFVLEHQERWDGKGYPNGLKGEKISLEARIIALADSYDAMTSERPYRGAMTKKEAIQELERNAGKQFDEELVKVFIDKVLTKA